MSLFSKLFGGKSQPAGPEPVDHKGFSITPCPEKAPGGFRIGAMIEKDGQSHHMIRADVIADETDAAEASLRKACQMIDEQGERLF
ncbi:HlyU family transcriptional regulator [Vannielia sp. SX4]|uniref:HlyU family transcriptional regulator n=1 Tax=Vannielia sp. SX4 TaxID=3463852 RepID=UPI0040584740